MWNPPASSTEMKPPKNNESKPQEECKITSDVAKMFIHLTKSSCTTGFFRVIKLCLIENLSPFS